MNVPAACSFTRRMILAPAVERPPGTSRVMPGKARRGVVVALRQRVATQSGTARGVPGGRSGHHPAGEASCGQYPQRRPSLACGTKRSTAGSRMMVSSGLGPTRGRTPDEAVPVHTRGESIPTSSRTARAALAAASFLSPRWMSRYFAWMSATAAGSSRNASTAGAKSSARQRS